MATELSSIGLMMAGATSVSNVVKDVASKKVLDNQAIGATTVWFRLVVLICVAATFAVIYFAVGGIGELRDAGPLFGISSLHLAPLPTFLIYVAIDGLVVGFAAYLYYRALQVSPISVCAPFLAFTPIFLIPTGYILLGELPAAVKLLGVGLVVVGSLVMHRESFKISLFEPFKALWREKGSRYVLIVAFIFSLTNPLDKVIVSMSDAFTHAFAYSVALFLFFAGIAVFQKADIIKPLKAAPGWLLLSGFLDSIALIFQLTSHNYIDVVITISVKRAGIVLAVLLGWLVFRETGITDRLIAAGVMLGGVLLIYLPLSVAQSVIFTGLILVGLLVALYLTRNQVYAAKNVEAHAAPVVGD